MKNMLSVLSLMLGLMICGQSMAKDSSDNNTLDFRTEAKTTVNSDSALVLVTVNATAVSKDTHTLQASVIATLSGYLPDVDWRVISLNQEQAASGAENIVVQCRARVSQSSLGSLSAKIKDARITNQRMTMQVLNYDAPEEVYRQANQQLMIKEYTAIQQYVDQFNKDTNSHYQIHDVSFYSNYHSHSFNDQMALSASVVLEQGGAHSKRSAKVPSVSQEITLQAHVTLSEQPSS